MHKDVSQDTLTSSANLYHYQHVCEANYAKLKAWLPCLALVNLYQYKQGEMIITAKLIDSHRYSSLMDVSLETNGEMGDLVSKIWFQLHLAKDLKVCEVKMASITNFQFARIDYNMTSNSALTEKLYWNIYLRECLEYTH